MSSNDNNKEDEPPTVLICHAGGESSRCPTQITLGKAWTSLPSKEVVKGGEPEEVVLNPTSLLISTLSHVFKDIPRGSVVVAASDVLLSFMSCNANNNGCLGEMNTIQFDGNSNGVFGLAVPAPLCTATNHGVFVVDNSNNDNSDDNNNSNNNNRNTDNVGWKLQSTFRVLQKPSIDEMISMTNPPCVFHTTTTTTTTNNNSNNTPTPDDEKMMAWIDTGVITFLPDAVATLRELSHTVLKNCTRVGLKELYREKYGSSCTIDDDNDKQPPPRLEEFTRGIAPKPKICLYGDMLHALQTTSSSSSSSSPSSSSSSSSSSNTVNVLFGTTLSKHELQTCIIPKGSFG